MSDFTQRWSSRKFWTMIGASIAFTGLLLADVLTEQTYAWLIGMTLGGYFTANVAQHIGAPK